MSSHILDVPAGDVPISERSAQRRDVNPERSLFDNGVRPDALPQLALSDDFARSLHQGHENLPRAAPERHRLVAAHQDPLCWK